MDNIGLPDHLGIIMDGNGRWAQARGLPRSAGHQAGVQTARHIIEACIDLGIHVLSLYAFSTENWSRPVEEVNYIMFLAEEYARSELPELKKKGVCLKLMGKRTGLPNPVLNAFDQMIIQTQNNLRLIVNIALNYGGREELVDATKAIITACEQGIENENSLDENTISHYLYCPDCPDVDLVIRTGGEWRLSNFLLWRTANSVFYSTPVLWPDFRQEHLQKLLDDYTKQVSNQYL
ncbi:MAG: polyprenyl diphosphate synthase [Anaerolineaceae bacterium]